MRLGDLDELFRAINKIKCPQGASMGDGLADACQAVLEAPTVDAVPVVRCSECIYYHDFETHYDCINGYGLDYYEPDDFCSYGERKDGEG